MREQNQAIAKINAQLEEMDGEVEETKVITQQIVSQSQTPLGFAPQFPDQGQLAMSSGVHSGVRGIWRSVPTGQWIPAIVPTIINERFTSAIMAVHAYIATKLVCKIYRRGTFGWDGTFDVGYDRHMYSI